MSELKLDEPPAHLRIRPSAIKKYLSGDGVSIGTIKDYDYKLIQLVLEKWTREAPVSILTGDKDQSIVEPAAHMKLNSEELKEMTGGDTVYISDLMDTN